MPTIRIVRQKGGVANRLITAQLLSSSVEDLRQGRNSGKPRLDVLREIGVKLEVGLIGCECVTGIPIILGNDRSASETFIQGEGDAKRIEAGKLRMAIAKSSSLQKDLLGFAHKFLNQTANTARGKVGTLASHGKRSIERRRGASNAEFLSLMLGVRRAGVTVALHYLEQRSLLNLSRRKIVITDRKGLQAAANGSYHQPERMG